MSSVSPFRNLLGFLCSSCRPYAEPFVARADAAEAEKARLTLALEAATEEAEDAISARHLAVSAAEDANAVLGRELDAAERRVIALEAAISRAVVRANERHTDGQPQANARNVLALILSEAEYAAIPPTPRASPQREPERREA